MGSSRSLLLVLAALAATAAAPAAASAALPKLVIRTDGKVADGPKRDGRMEIRNVRTGYEGRIGIELRGTSSLRFAKKSYAVETRFARGDEGRAVSLLGLPREADWVLGSAYADATLMRNVVGYQLARRLGRPAPRTRFVELVLNGDYKGLYVLTERPRPARGAALLEQSDTPEDFPAAVSPRHYAYYDPAKDELSKREERGLADAVHAAERALYGLGGVWREHIDEMAAVDYVLLQELLKNQDAFSRSTFLELRRRAPLRLGPLWDLDRAMGDRHAGERAGPTGWITADRPWGHRFLGDANFVHALVRQRRASRMCAPLAQRRLARAPGRGPTAAGVAARPGRLDRREHRRAAPRWVGRLRLCSPAV